MAITAATMATAETHLDAAEFDAEVASHGTPVVVRRALTCPCFSSITGHAQTDCPYCEHGFGIIWDEGYTAKILAPGRPRRDDYDSVGFSINGMITLTFPSTVTPGHLDLVELMVAEMVVNRELLVRGEINKLGRSTERLRFRNVIMVERVVAIVGGALEEYGVPTDLSVLPDASVQWVEGLHGPPGDVQYSVRYRARPSYVVLSPRSRDEGGQKMPYRCEAMRLDFFEKPAVGEGTVI